jgi:hypothetical protein
VFLLFNQKINFNFGEEGMGPEKHLLMFWPVDVFGSKVDVFVVDVLVS